VALREQAPHGVVADIRFPAQVPGMHGQPKDSA
jgi:hypothetical protein